MVDLRVGDLEGRVSWGGDEGWVFGVGGCKCGEGCDAAGAFGIHRWEFGT